MVNFAWCKLYTTNKIVIYNNTKFKVKAKKAADWYIKGISFISKLKVERHLGEFEDWFCFLFFLKKVKIS